MTSTVSTLRESLLTMTVLARLVLIGITAAEAVLILSVHSPGSGTGTISARASWMSRFGGVELYVDGKMVKRCERSPCQLVLDTTRVLDAVHGLRVAPHNGDGIFSTSRSDVRVQNKATFSQAYADSQRRTTSAGASLPFQWNTATDSSETNTPLASPLWTSTSRVLRVGPGRLLKAPSNAASMVKDGDIVDIDAADYVGDVAVWSASHLTLRGVGGRVHLNANGMSAQRKGIWVLAGTNTTVENVEFSNATVPDRNGAGIRLEGPGLIVRNCYFHDNENGLLTANNASSDVIVENSEFARNGFGDGLSHNIYVGEIRSFTLRYSYSHHAKIGHQVKARAHTNYILYNRIMDEATGNGSYEIDLPQGGRSYIIGNIIQKSPRANNAVLVAYAAESQGNPSQELYVINNSMVNDRPTGAFVRVSGTPVVKLVNNILVGGSRALAGATGVLTSNLNVKDPLFVDRANFDYRLTAGSPAIDAGTDPGVAAGFNLTPVSQYVHVANHEPRRIVGKSIDIGAYEFPR